MTNAVAVGVGSAVGSTVGVGSVVGSSVADALSMRLFESALLAGSIENCRMMSMRMPANIIADDRCLEFLYRCDISFSRSIATGVLIITDECANRIHFWFILTQLYSGFDGYSSIVERI